MGFQDLAITVPLPGGDSLRIQRAWVTTAFRGWRIIHPEVRWIKQVGPVAIAVMRSPLQTRARERLYAEKIERFEDRYGFRVKWPGIDAAAVAKLGSIRDARHR